MRRFELHRDQDTTGISGTGVVAQGVLLDPTPYALTVASQLQSHDPERLVAMQWMTEWPTSVVFHQRGLASLEHVHGHSGRTRTVWLDPPDDEAPVQADGPAEPCPINGASCPACADYPDAHLLARLGTDAMVWAKDFMRRFAVTRRSDGEPGDEGLMVGWFANAIEAGRDAGQSARP